MSSMAKAEGKKPMSYWIHALICVAFMFGFGFLPPLGGEITPLGMRVLGVFIGLFYGWIFLEFTWPSLLGLVALGITDYSTIGGAFVEGLKNDTTINILLMFIFSAYLEKTGALKWVTYWIISRKALVGRPWLFTVVFIAAIMPLAVFVNVFAGIIMMWAMFYTVCEVVGLEKKDMYVSYVIFGIANLGAFLQIAFPWQPLSLAIFKLAGPANGITEIPFGAWTLFGLGMCTIFPLMYYILGKFVLRIDVSKMAAMGDQFAEYRGIKMNSEQKFGIGLLAFFILMIVLPTYTTGPVKAFLSNFGIQGTAILCIVIAFLYQLWNGGSFYSFGNMVRDGVNWDLLILFIVTFPISTALESGDAGVINTVINMIMPVVNSLSPLLFLMVVCVIFCMVTQVSHNLVLMIALIPSLAKIAASIGFNPFVFGLVFALTCQIAVSTPAASAATAMVFGNTEWVEKGYAYKIGVVTLVFWLAAALAIMIPFTMLIF